MSLRVAVSASRRRWRGNLIPRQTIYPTWEDLDNMDTAATADCQARLDALPFQAHPDITDLIGEMKEAGYRPEGSKTDFSRSNGPHDVSIEDILELASKGVLYDIRIGSATHAMDERYGFDMLWTPLVLALAKRAQAFSIKITDEPVCPPDYPEDPYLLAAAPYMDEFPVNEIVRRSLADKKPETVQCETYAGFSDGNITGALTVTVHLGGTLKDGKLSQRGPHGLMITRPGQWEDEIDAALNWRLQHGLDQPTS